MSTTPETETRCWRLPPGLLFGVATAAYQIEGAPSLGGRTLPSGTCSLRSPAGSPTARPNRSPPTTCIAGRRMWPCWPTSALAPTGSRCHGHACNRTSRGAGVAGRYRVLRPPPGRVAGRGHRAVRLALPLGPAAGTDGTRRLVGPRDRRPLRRLRRIGCVLAGRPGDGMDNGGRTVAAHGLWPRTGHRRPCPHAARRRVPGHPSPNTGARPGPCRCCDQRPADGSASSITTPCLLYTSPSPRDGL